MIFTEIKSGYVIEIEESDNPAHCGLLHCKIQELKRLIELTTK